jgi:hypothetical protein
MRKMQDVQGRHEDQMISAQDEGVRWQVRKAEWSIDEVEKVVRVRGMKIKGHKSQMTSAQGTMINWWVVRK